MDCSPFRTLAGDAASYCLETPTVEEAMPHLGHAFRALQKAPVVTGVAVLSLALGIGANAAIFSIFDQMILRALSVPHPERLVNLAAPGPKPGSNSSNNAGRTDAVFSYPMFRDLERAQTVLTGLAAHRSFVANLGYQGETTPGQGTLVSGSYFPVLELRPVLGRLFTPEDDVTVGGHPLVVLSHGYWRRRFAESPAVLGQTLVVNGQLLTVVGVSPPGFVGTTLGSRPDVFVPITMRGLMAPGFQGFENRRSYWAYLFGRLRPGVSLAQARSALNAPYRALVNDVEAALQTGMSAETLARFKAKELALDPGPRGQSVLHREARAPLLLLLAVTGIVLLIACANVANLLLARGAARASELAVRAAIGAGRRQLVAQLLAESCLLAALGGALGLFVARGTLRLVLSLLPAEPAATLQAQIDPALLGFVAALALGTGLVFGLYPALSATRPDLVTSLRGQAGQAGGSRGAARFRNGLATAQIALSMALLVAAGLFTKSLVQVSRVDLGLETDHLLTFTVSPELNGYTPARSEALFAGLEDEVAAVPGVDSISASLVPLISGSNWGNDVTVEGFAAGPDTDTNAAFNLVGPGFFRTLGMPLLAGREFTRRDARGAPKVAVVNEAFARKFRLGGEVVGKRMRTGRGEGPLDVEIVGLVRDAKYSEVKRDVPPQYFVPYRQDETGLGRLNFYVRTTREPGSILSALPAVLARLDPNLPLERPRTMDAQVRENVFVDRIISTLAAAFAVLATLLAAIGLYGVLAYTVAQRTREIGVRMALGATAGRVRGMVLGQLGRMVLVGGGLGLAAAIGLGRVARSLLYELESHDPLVLVFAATALALVCLVAGLLPARRAARVDPLRALRYE
jgi:predicted permease